MGYAVLGLSILIGILFRHSKLASMLISILIWILVCANTYNADYVAYSAYYDSVLAGMSSGISDIGYNLLVSLFGSLGMNYIAFRLIVGAAAIILIYTATSSITNNHSHVLSLYCVAPMMYDVVQFRFFLATSIVLFGIRYLIQKKYLQYLTLIIIASTIHFTCIIYALLMMSAIDKMKMRKASLVACVISLILIRTGMLAHILLYLHFDTKLGYYTNHIGMQYFAYWAPLLWTWISITLSEKRVNHLVKERTGRVSYPVRYTAEGFDDFIHSVKYFFLLLAVLVLFNGAPTFRLFRGLLIPIYAYYDELLSLGRDFGERSEHWGDLVLFFVFIALVFFVLYYRNWNNIVVSELANNLFWS